MRRPHALFLALLTALTLAVFWKLLEDEFPFKGWAHYYSTTTLDRKAAGYDSLPQLNDNPMNRNDPDERFLPYASYSNRGEANFFGYEYWDDAYWPDGDPGLGAKNPLPRLIKRHAIYAVSPTVLFSILGVGWLGWSLALTRAVLRPPPRGNGFDVLPPEGG